MPLPAAVLTYALIGIDAAPVTVEVDLLSRLPQVVISGLSSTAARETADRIRSAITASGHEFPRRRVVISLSPADMRKDFTLDLAVAVGVMRAVRGEGSEGRAYIGELSLSGDVRPVRGVVAMARAAKAAGLTLVCHPDNARDARALGCSVLAVRTLQDALDGFSWHDLEAPQVAARVLDFSDVRGRSSVIAQLRAAAANRCPVLFVGPPGCGKAALAARMSSLLTPLTEAERVEVAQIQDAAGLRTPGSGFDVVRPLRMPHHSISPAGLIGGTNARPGECSLAHKGVLFLDDLPHFPRAVLEALRGPVVAGQMARLAYAGGVVNLPADFWLVGAANPCSCGHLGHPTRPCLCSADSRERYDARLEAARTLLFKDALRIDLAPVAEEATS